MRSITIILFFFLWFFNTEITIWIYPNFNSSNEAFKEWYYLRCRIYEVMFLISYLIPIKEDRYSESLRYSVMLVLFFSAVDKLLNSIFGFHPHDIIVYAFSILIGLLVYHKKILLRAYSDKYGQPK